MTIKEAIKKHNIKLEYSNRVLYFDNEDKRYEVCRDISDTYMEPIIKTKNESEAVESLLSEPKSNLNF